MATTSSPSQDSATASRKSYSYHWRIFIPLLVSLWLSITVIAYFQFEVKRQTVIENSRANLQRSHTYLLQLLDEGDNPKQALDYVHGYLSLTKFEDISIAIFDNHTGECITSAGFDMPLPDGTEFGHKADFFKAPAVSRIAIDDNGQRIDMSPRNAFYHSTVTADNGRYVVQTIMPNNMQLTDFQLGSINMRLIWTYLIVGLFMSWFAFMFTRHLARNIILLRDFANRAAHDNNFVETDKFPNDELGEISRQIVHIYNTRTQALLAREQEHLVALRATQERARIKRQLTNNINHELKTPTVIIRGYIDTILSDPDMPEKTRMRFLESTKVQVERLVQMLADLSTLTRLEESNQMIQTEPVNMHDLLFSVSNDLQQSNVLGNITFSYDLPDECIVVGNEALLGGVIMNLAKNSIAYAKCDNIGMKLLATNKKYYTFSFWDDGTGVPPEHLPHLFERFFRIDTGRSRKNGGTGLGLPIVKNTITSLGGSAIMRNRAGGGLECVFTLLKWTGENSQPHEDDPEDSEMQDPISPLDTPNTHVTAEE